MKKKFKKTNILMSTLLISTPLVSVISCGNNFIDYEEYIKNLEIKDGGEAARLITQLAFIDDKNSRISDYINNKSSDVQGHSNSWNYIPGEIKYKFEIPLNDSALISTIANYFSDKSKLNSFRTFVKSNNYYKKTEELVYEYNNDKNNNSKLLLSLDYKISNGYIIIKPGIEKVGGFFSEGKKINKDAMASLAWMKQPSNSIEEIQKFIDLNYKKFDHFDEYKNTSSKLWKLLGDSKENFLKELNTKYTPLWYMTYHNDPNIMNKAEVEVGLKNNKFGLGFYYDNVTYNPQLLSFKNINNLEENYTCYFTVTNQNGNQVPAYTVGKGGIALKEQYLLKHNKTSANDYFQKFKLVLDEKSNASDKMKLILRPDANPNWSTGSLEDAFYYDNGEKNVSITTAFNNHPLNSHSLSSQHAFGYDKKIQFIKSDGSVVIKDDFKFSSIAKGISHKDHPNWKLQIKWEIAATKGKSGESNAGFILDPIGAYWIHANGPSNNAAHVKDIMKFIKVNGVNTFNGWSIDEKIGKNKELIESLDRLKNANTNFENDYINRFISPNKADPKGIEKRTFIYGKNGKNSPITSDWTSLSDDQFKLLEEFMPNIMPSKKGDNSYIYPDIWSNTWNKNYSAYTIYKYNEDFVNGIKNIILETIQVGENTKLVKSNNIISKIDNPLDIQDTKFHLKGYDYFKIYNDEFQKNDQNNFYIDVNELNDENVLKENYKKFANAIVYFATILDVPYIKNKVSLLSSANGFLPGLASGFQSIKNWSDILGFTSKDPNKTKWKNTIDIFKKFDPNFDSPNNLLIKKIYDNFLKVSPKMVSSFSGIIHNNILPLLLLEDPNVFSLDGTYSISDRGGFENAEIFQANSLTSVSLSMIAAIITELYRSNSNIWDQLK
ncbi:MAG: hypothetical protein K4H23_05235 [Mollicutes bacterium PWAP]|nr:hypothetical protein [Mollicutes bacterium PWAP]